MTLYDEAFYNTLNDAGANSAHVVLSYVVGRLNPGSAVDVGCGTGIWASTLVELGVDDVLGIDGEYVPKRQLRVSPARFRSVDLAAPFDLGRTFDLVVCVEVAEHLSADRADGLVADLCQLGSALVFSAATPKQGGTHHINEQWPDYWISKFASQGFTCWDVIRPRIRYDRRVAWIYRQNLMLVLGPGHPQLSSLDPEVEQLRLPANDDVAFEYVARYIVEREDSAKTALIRAIRRRSWPGRKHGSNSTRRSHFRSDRAG